MARAIVLNAYGGPEQLALESVDVQEPDAGEVLIRQTAVGVNFVDTYCRRGLYPVPLPAIIGNQGVGVVEGLGDGETDFEIGDRVGYGSSNGGYVDMRVIKSKDIVRVPDGISDEVVAAALTRGMTAEFLLFRVHQLEAGETVIVHAATGGTGLIVCQWAKHLGATVIATVGSKAKIAMAEAAGADHVLLHDAVDFVDGVSSITNGRGVDVVYDSIGKTTFANSLECLRPRGLMVAYGNASGKPDPLDVLSLASQGSLFLTRPRLWEYVGTKVGLELSTSRFFDAVETGIVQPSPVEAFALADAASAHVHLEDRAKHTIPILVP